jgi:hypothetical protein
MWGAQYVLMDDCWSDTSRDANGNLQPNMQQFPLGTYFSVRLREVFVRSVSDMYIESRQAQWFFVLRREKAQFSIDDCIFFEWDGCGISLSLSLCGSEHQA